MTEGKDRIIVLEICPLDGVPARFEVTKLVVPGSEGAFTVLPGHAPLTSALEIGTLTADLATGQRESFAINGGMVQVLKDRVVVLTRTSERGEEIDVERAERAKERAERRLTTRDEGLDVFRAELALRRALARLRTRTQLE